MFVCVFLFCPAILISSHEINLQVKNETRYFALCESLKRVCVFLGSQISRRRNDSLESRVRVCVCVMKQATHESQVAAESVYLCESG